MASLLTVDNLLIVGIAGGVGAYFFDIPAGFKADVDDFFRNLTQHDNNPVECSPSCKTGEVCQDGACVPDDGSTEPGGDCDSYGGDCDKACEHGCQGSNCVACMSACSLSCADTKTSASCDYTCSHKFCTSFREKGCSGCSACKGSGSSGSGYPIGPYGVSEYPIEYYDPYATRYWTMQPDAYPLDGPVVRGY